jgi:hypothetical protein
MNTRSAREYTMLAPAQILRNLRDQRPSNQGDLDSSVTGEVGGGPTSDFIFVPFHMIVVGLNFKWYAYFC